MKKLLLLLALTATVSPAAIIQFDLVGTAGPGLLFGNEPAVASGGSGGEIGAGIFYDDVINQLTLNVGWGSSQGFNDLSSASNNAHVHGPTASVNGNNGVGDWRQTAGVAINLTRSSNALTGGIVTNTTHTLTATQETQLLEGRFYINLHTANNGGGEIRGFLTPVPEPSAALCGLAALGAMTLRRRRA